MSLPNRGISRSPTFHRWSGSERLSEHSAGMGIDRMLALLCRRLGQFLFVCVCLCSTRRLRKEEKQ